MTSDQELFAKGLAPYEKVVAANYRAHEQVYNVLHEVLLREPAALRLFLKQPREAGFEQADELFIGKQLLARVYLFRH